MTVPLIAPVLAVLLNAPGAPAAPESLIDQQRLMDIVRALPEKRSSWGNDEHHARLRATEKLVADRLRALGYAPEFDPVDALGTRDRDGGNSAPTGTAPPEKPVAWNNVIVDIPGRTLPKQILVLSAHTDSVSVSPGADDDGTGVATVLEAARVLKDQPMQRTVRLILFNLEEVGMVGSRAYTERLKPRLDAGEEQVVGMVSLDMIGYFSDEPGSQSSPLQLPGFSPPTVGDFVVMGGILKNRPFHQALADAMHAAEPRCKTEVVDFFPVAPPDLTRSDHAPFLALGVPAVILTDTANFRNPNYHKATDTVSTIDEARFTRAAKAIVGAVYRLAGPVGGELPDWGATSQPAEKPAAQPDPASK